MKVVLGVVLSHGFPVPADFVIGYALLQQTILTGDGNRHDWLPDDRQIDAAGVLWSHAFPTDVARNEICRLFLDEGDGDALLFLDADMKHPPDLAHRLVAHRRDVVTARYTTRRPPFWTVAFRKTGPLPTDYTALEHAELELRGLMPVDAGGAGALLISRPALVAVRAAVGDDWFRYQDGPAGKRSRSEDMWFYEQAKACGFQAYLDAETVCAHVAQFGVTPDWHVPYVEALAKAQARQEVVA